MKTRLTLLSIFFSLTASSQSITLDSIPDGSGHTYIASPIGVGPYPAVLYNHGGLGDAVGGDLRGTAVALAELGYLIRAEKRMETISMAGHLAEVEAALDSLRADPRADTSCVSIIGFSRGGLLTLQAGISQASKVHAIISMAPASANGQLESTLTDLSAINDPVLVLVANNDTFQDNHVLLAQMTYDSLIATGKTATLTVYPDYDSNGDLIIDSNDDGHELFFIVQDPYWSDVINFLNATNCNSTSGNLPDTDKEKIRVVIYPNPLTHNSTLKIISPYTTEFTFEFYDYLGRMIKQITTSQTEITLEKTDFDTGVYFYRLLVNNKALEQGKLIVN
ncbi:MAG: T9SS type A sorting domain-containing protein [Bacteroidia bacterium]|nr:T9SS type A sorting domain-containing protein [Bacteroidia bacterium]